MQISEENKLWYLYFFSQITDQSADFTRKSAFYPKFNTPPVFCATMTSLRRKSEKHAQVTGTRPGAAFTKGGKKYVRHQLGRRGQHSQYM